MKFQKQWDSVKNFCAKVGKRNWIIFGALVLIAGAVVLNVVLFQNANDKKGGYDYTNQNGMSNAGNNNGGTTDVNNNQSDDNSDSYFSSVQVSRERARDEAMEVLQGVVDNASADEASKTEALGQITQLAKEMDQESKIETLILAKGFKQCVAVISDGEANIVVKSENLVANQIAQINEIVYEQAGIKPEKITIIPR